MGLTKGQRLALYWVALEAAPAASDGDQALQILNEIMKDIEDRESGVPYNSTEPGNDGRMYGPSVRFKRDVPGRLDVIRYAQVQHDTFIRSNGAIKIVERKSGDAKLNKPGADGRSIDDE